MYYKHSGRFGFGGILSGLIAGCVAACVVGYLYGRGLSLIPEAHFAVFATMAFGALVGAATGWGLMRGHVRNKEAVLAVTTFSSALALYVSWAVWIDVAFRRNGNNRFHWGALVVRPDAMWYLMKWINHYGTWGLDNNKSPVEGWSLWAVWTGEALVVVGIALAAAVGIGLGRPFCETCERWCRRTARLVLASTPDGQQLKQQIENKDLRPLEDLGPAQKASDHLIATLHSCDQCCQFHTLSLTQVLVRREKFGQAPIRSNTLLRFLVIDPGQAQTLRQLSEKLMQASKLSPARARGAAAGK